MAPRSSTTPRGFTLVEMIIVMTIIAILSVAAMVDYGVSIKKARLDVAVEELVGLLHEAQVRSQTIVHTPDTPDEVVCWVVVLGVSEAPVLTYVPWDDSTKTCSGDVYAGETFHESHWHNAVNVDSITWETTASSQGVTTGSVSSVAFLFTPPGGQIAVYLNPTSPVVLSEATEVSIHVSYGGISEVAFNKTLKIAPVTSSFLIFPGDGEE